MTVNLMPITGIPLPFFSYGGSFLLASSIESGAGAPGGMGRTTCRLCRCVAMS